MPPTLDIVIVNYNAGDALFSCAASIAGAKDTSFGLRSVVVVDNGSTDGSLYRLGGLDLPLTVLKNGRNEGFGAACNRGAACGRADYVLFLNPDTRLFPDSLRAPLGVFSAPGYEETGICSVRLVDESGVVRRTCARFPRPVHFILRAFHVGRLFPGPRTTHFMLEWDHGQTRYVDHVMGAFWLMPRRVFEEVGGFDTRFFLYLEDVDFSLRARRLGYRSLYLADAAVFHKGGGTSEKVRDLRLFYSLQSRILYGFKHFSRPAAAAAAFFALAVEPFTRLVFAVLRLRFGEAGHTLKAYKKLYAWCLRPGRRK